MTATQGNAESIARYLAGLKTGSFGLPVSFDLGYFTSRSTVATGLDYITMPLEWEQDRAQHVARICSATILIGGLGTGATSGNWTVNVVRASDGVVIAQAVFAYNAAVLAQQVSCLQSNGAGFAMGITDQLRLDLATVPVGLTGGMTGIVAHISAVGFGSRG